MPDAGILSGHKHGMMTTVRSDATPQAGDDDWGHNGPRGDLAADLIPNFEYIAFFFFALLFSSSSLPLPKSIPFAHAHLMPKRFIAYSAVHDRSMYTA